MKSISRYSIFKNVADCEKVKSNYPTAQMQFLSAGTRVLVGQLLGSWATRNFFHVIAEF